MRSSRPSWRSVPTVLLVVVAVTATLLSACSGDSSGHPTVTDAWVRLPQGSADVTAAYMTLHGFGRDSGLVSASSPLAASVTLHETTTDPSGMTGMHGLDVIVVRADSTVRLEPGGYHLMLEGLKQRLVVGQSIELALVFEGGTVVVQAEVRGG